MKDSFNSNDLAPSLHHAIFNRDFRIVESILSSIKKQNLDIDSLIFIGVTPLQRAAFLGHTRIVTLLLKAGSDPTIKKNDKTAKDYALEQGHDTVVKLLSGEMGEIKSKPIIEILYEAITQNQQDEFLKHIGSFHFDFFQIHDNKTHEMLEVIRKKIDELIKEARLESAEVIRYIPADGNCMYSAALLGAGSEETILDLRSNVATIIESSLDHYAPFIESQLLFLVDVRDIQGFSQEVIIIINNLRLLDENERLNYIRNHNLVEEYVNLIKEDKFWGGEIELGIISILLNVQINVHMPNGNINNINNTEDDNAPTIELSFSGRHYNLITGYRFNVIDDSTIDYLASLEFTNDTTFPAPSSDIVRILNEDDSDDDVYHFDEDDNLVIIGEVHNSDV